MRRSADHSTDLLEDPRGLVVGEVPPALVALRSLACRLSIALAE